MKKEDDDFAHYGMLSKPNSAISFSNSPRTGMEPLQPRDYVRVKDRQGQNGLSVAAEETAPDLDDVPF